MQDRYIRFHGLHGSCRCYTSQEPSPASPSPQHAHEPTMGSRTYSYYVLGYFGSCHYCFVFSDFDISAEQIHNTLGHLIIQIEEIPWVSNLPGNGVNDWTMIQRKDVLIGEGGVM